MDAWHLVLAVVAAGGWASLAAFIASHRELLAVYERNNEADMREVAHLRSLLARKDAPVEEMGYMADANPQPPAVPENALWDESGLYFTEGD